jgi:hypothetical protein
MPNRLSRIATGTGDDGNAGQGDGTRGFLDRPRVQARGGSANSIPVLRQSGSSARATNLWCQAVAGSLASRPMNLSSMNSFSTVSRCICSC